MSFNFNLDTKLLINQVENNLSPLKAKILTLYLQRYNIAEICRKLKLKRFKVNKELKETFEYLKPLIEEDRK